MEHFDGLTTSRETPVRTVRALVGKGLVESLGLGVVCDGDGFAFQPERWREVFRLTPKGREVVEAVQ